VELSKQDAAVAVASRAKDVQLIRAREVAEQKAIEVTVSAEAEKHAAANRAEANLIEARAQAERIRVVAEADQKRLEVEAFGERAINEAKNILSQELVRFELQKLIAQLAPEMMAASVKPMEKIESIRIIQANGFGGVGSAGGGAAVSGNSGSLPNQVVEAALGYRMNLPLVESLLREIGLEPSSVEGLLKGLNKASGLSPAPAPGAGSNEEAELVDSGVKDKARSR
jgi:uncharacterized membrane protein YqiK